MQNCFVGDRELSIVCSGAVVDLTIVPMTFGRLIDINSALPENKDLSKVMEEPEPLDLAIVTYCLLSESSRQKIGNIPLHISGEEEEASGAEKLFYLMCESNITDGLQNYNKILTAIVDQVKASTAQPETKKKRFLGKVFQMVIQWMLRKFTTKSAQHIITPIKSS